MLLSWVFASCCCLLVLSGAADVANSLSSGDLLEQARHAIAHGELDAAGDLLSRVEGDDFDLNDFDFLRGTLAMRRGDYGTAIAAFRAILRRSPGLQRVRLDLARAYFLAGDDAAARHHFDRAAAAGLPTRVQQRVDDYLDRMKRRKRWSINVTIGIAPDSNINAATASNIVHIYGLPFHLDPSARKTSGIGISGQLGAAYHLPLTNALQLRIAGRIDEMNYSGKSFDHRTLSGSVGPRFLANKSAEVTFLVTGLRRWYGGAGYSRGIGGRITTRTRLMPRLILGGSVDLYQMTYDRALSLDGPQFALGTFLTYRLDARSAIRLDVAYLREWTRSKPNRNNRYVMAAQYTRHLPWEFVIDLSGSLGIVRHDAPYPAFGATRRDVTARYDIGLSNKHLDLFGFTPVISLGRDHRWSNISLFDYRRSRLEFSVRRNF
jgi:tetratricopeptide (TPR) repeat protein